MAADDAVVEVTDLTKKYGEFVALDRLTLSVARGQILGFIGPHGAGKTTAIKILVGLARPTSGTARIGGIDCSAEPRRVKRLVGYMPDTFGGYDNMRVSEYLDFFGAAFGLRRRERAGRVGAVLEAAGAGRFRDLFVESLSHGMKQRVAVARTLLHDPAGSHPGRAGERPGPARPHRDAAAAGRAGRAGQDAHRHQPHPARVGPHLPSGGDRHPRPAAGVRHPGRDRPPVEPAPHHRGAAHRRGGGRPGGGGSPPARRTRRRGDARPRPSSPSASAPPGRTPTWPGCWPRW